MLIHDNIYCLMAKEQSQQYFAMIAHGQSANFTQRNNTFSLRQLMLVGFFDISKVKIGELTHWHNSNTEQGMFLVRLKFYRELSLQFPC